MTDFGRDRAEARAGELAEFLFSLSCKQRTTLPISGKPTFTKFIQTVVNLMPTLDK